MDDNGWFVTGLMYVGMLLGTLSKGIRRIARRHRRAFAATSIGIFAIPIVYVNFFVKQIMQAVGLNLMITLVFIVWAGTYMSSRNEEPKMESEPAYADPDDWLNG